MATGFDIRIATKNSVHPKLSGASDDYHGPQSRDAYRSAVRDGLIQSNNNSDITYEFTSTAGKAHNTFNGVHTKYRPSLNSDHPFLRGNTESTMDLDYYTQNRESVPYPQRRAMSVEPTQVHAHTIDRVRRDASKDRRRRNVSGERTRRGVSVDRTAVHDGSIDRKRDKSNDRTRSDVNLNRRPRDVSGDRARHVDYSSMVQPHIHHTSPKAQRITQSPTDRDMARRTPTTITRREPSADRSKPTLLVDDSDSEDSDTDGGNYVRLAKPPNPPPNMGRQASRQTSSESNNSVFERGTTPRNSNTSKGRPSFTSTTSPGFTRVNYGDSSPHYNSGGGGHQGIQALQTHHTSPTAHHRNHSPNSINFSSSSSEMNDYVNWKPVDDLPDEPPPPRPPRPTKLDIKHQPNCAPPSMLAKTQPRLSRTGTPQSATDDHLRSRFSPGGSPPPTTNQKKMCVAINVDDRPSLPPKPCPGPQLTPQQTTPSSEYL